MAELRRQLEEHYQAALKQALSRAETAADKGPVRALSPVQAASQRLETASPGVHRCHSPSGHQFGERLGYTCSRRAHTPANA